MVKPGQLKIQGGRIKLDLPYQTNITMIDLLIERLNSLARPHTMPDLLEKRLKESAVICRFACGKYILRKGQVCNGTHFLVKGLARSYYSEGAKEVTSRLMQEGFIITSWLSFYQQEASLESIIAMEDCDTIFIPYSTINSLYDDFPIFNVIGRRQVEYSFSQSELRVQMLRGLSALERYSFFCRTHSSLLQRVPLKYIASYLGMSDETLSRIRSNYKKIAV
jgi:CRP/FNR family transcriptional regulator, anaerobic regulatory protein